MKVQLIRRLAKLRRVYGVMRAVANHPLHRGNRARAVLRWTRLLAAVNLTPTRQIAVPYINGAVLHWPADSTSVMICARYGLGEHTDMAFCLHLLRPEDLVCDVGANAGVYTVLAAHGVGCRVVAVEPVPRTFDLLMQNIYANALSERVDPHRAGVGRQAGRLHFTASLWSYNHVVDAPGPDTVEVEVSTLDTILAGREPTLLKIDVEGFEGEVLAGAARTLASSKLQAVLIEMADGVERYGGSLDTIKAVLQAAGLSGPYWYDPAERQLVVAGTPELRHFNQIFVRDPAFVASRLAGAKRFTVNEAVV